MVAMPAKLEMAAMTAKFDTKYSENVWSCWIILEYGFYSQRMLWGIWKILHNNIHKFDYSNYLKLSKPHATVSKLKKPHARLSKFN